MDKVLTPTERWQAFITFLSFPTAFGLWITSIAFSYIGFKPDPNVALNWYFTAFAIVLSWTITIMELLLNNKQVGDVFGKDADFRSVALLVGGFACYMYGIWTNIVGISTMMLSVSDKLHWQSWIVPVIAGILLEVLPEPMLLTYIKSKKVEKPHQQPQEQRRDDTRNKVRGHFEHHPVGMEPRRVDRVPDEIRTLHKIPSAPMPRGNR